MLRLSTYRCWAPGVLPDHLAEEPLGLPDRVLERHPVGVRPAHALHAPRAALHLAVEGQDRHARQRQQVRTPLRLLVLLSTPPKTNNKGALVKDKGNGGSKDQQM